MKKYLTAAALLAAGTAIVNAAATWTVENSATSTATNAWYNGIAFNLSVEENSRLTITGDLDLSSEDSVYLTSLSTNIRDMQSAANLSLLVCDADNNIIGVSSDSVSSTGDVTWNFTDVEISTKSVVRTYFIFLRNAGDARAAIGTSVTEADSTNSWLVMAGGSTVIQYGNTTGADSLYFLGSNTQTNYTLESTQTYAPVLELTLTAIPEPSAFGLIAGAGALALVTARRRRRAK